MFQWLNFKPAIVKTCTANMRVGYCHQKDMNVANNKDGTTQNPKMRIKLAERVVSACIEFRLAVVVTSAYSVLLVIRVNGR